MPDRYLRQSALAHLHLAARVAEEQAEAPVVLSERAFRGMVNLRGDPGEKRFLAAAKTVLGADLPLDPNTTAQAREGALLWLGPDEWLLELRDGGEAEIAERLRSALAGQRHSVVEVGHSRALIGVDGPRARDVLMKGCSLDLHPRAFRPGHCAQTLLARAGMILRQVDDGPSYDLNVRRSFAEYVWTWLEDAAAEYGYAVGRG